MYQFHIKEQLYQREVKCVHPVVRPVYCEILASVLQVKSWRSSHTLSLISLIISHKFFWNTAFTTMRHLV